MLDKKWAIEFCLNCSIVPHPRRSYMRWEYYSTPISVEDFRELENYFCVFGIFYKDIIIEDNFVTSFSYFKDFEGIYIEMHINQWTASRMYNDSTAGNRTILRKYVLRDMSELGFDISEYIKNDIGAVEKYKLRTTIS